MRTLRNKTRNSLLAAALAAASAVGARAQAAPEPAPEPAALLDAVLAPPTVAYEGRVMVTQWFGRNTRAEEMRVYALPPDRVRREFLAPDGRVVRVSVSDGQTESVRLVRSGKVVLGNAVRSYEKVLPFELERDVLLSNYELASSTGESVAGRTTWRLTLEPKVKGKAWQTMWIDRDTKVVLRTKRYIPKRASASQAQFVAFEPRKAADPALFEVEDSTVEVVEARHLAPEFLTLEQLNKAGGEPVSLPEKLPGGFVFESADAFPVRGSRVRHARYTDGLTVVSLFLTDRPVSLPKGGVIAASDVHLPGSLRASSAGKVTRWGSGRRHYMLIGDVSRELVADIVKFLR